MSIWNFSHKPDSDWGEDDSSGKAVQPDHYPNVARPGGGYPEGKGEESDTPCKTCNQNNLVDGRCPLCDWPNSVSEPIKNFPLDPFRDDKAGIRAGSLNVNANKPWVKTKTLTNMVKEVIENDRAENEGFSSLTNQKIAEIVLPLINAERIKRKREKLNMESLTRKIQSIVSKNKFRTPEETQKQINLAGEQNAQKNVIRSFIKMNPKSKKYIDGLLEAQREDGARLYGNLEIAKKLSDKFNISMIDKKIIDKYVELEGLNRPPLLENPTGKLQLDDQKKLLGLLQTAAQQEGSYSPSGIASQIKELTKIKISPESINYWVKKWKKEGLLSEELKSTSGGGYNPQLPGYIYVIQSKQAIKIGISNYIDRRLNEHGKNFNVNNQIPLNVPEKVQNQLPIPKIFSNNQQPAYVSPVIQDGNIPLLIEKQIVNWWRNNLKLNADEIHPNESILQGSMDVNLVINMVERLLANYGVASEIPEQERSSLIQTYGPEHFQINDPNNQQANFFPSSMGFDVSDAAIDQENNNVDQMQLFSKSKVSDHQGSTNWETWNTKVMIDNEYNLYMQSREMVKNFTPLNEFSIWATQAVIAPHNQQALENAQEWNDIPYDERPTGREHMSEGGQALTEGFDEIFGMDPRADETASIIDESKVDWPQIYNSIAEDIKESERFDHEEGKHDLLTQMYMTDFTAEELGDLQEETYPWCPICKVEHPDDPGDLTIPSDWTQ